ncbi:beta-aspartyl-peptidase [Mesoterricola silvestris]|uniref:Isoaspartyl dipeptidase n=1 Tax=Mesoterricola silvestris TaxID=2927979 RepID=A0AA48H109_9BACT|nr:beta-aspartyl-peptidase [Mesoterricola silvestris]BDU74053.1 isoaspartyl dipeptidase [Mesoterricola silvestris]
MLLIKNADIHSPSPEGRCDLLAGGGKILRMHPDIRIPRRYLEVIDARNLIAVPGFIDGHVHIMGGGGEGGPATRTPELAFSDAVLGGVTTIVGCLGTDGVTRTMAGLLAKAQGLEAEGITTFALTGHYAVPVHTLTGSIEGDLLCIEKILGVGEVAMSDHRSSQPTFEDFARLAGETRRGGILSGKAGVVNIHLGDGRRGLEYLRRLLLETEVPARQFLPTHINRNPTLFEEGTAYALAGGFVDFTTSTVPAFVEAGEIKPSEGLRRMLDAGVDPGHITFTSDGQGSLPDFDVNGRIQGVGVGRVTSLFPEVRDAVQKEGVPLATALRVITSNPARIFKLHAKGQLAPGMDADIVLLDPRDLSIHTMIAKGRVLMKAGKVLVKGTFE